MITDASPTVKGCAEDVALVGIAIALNASEFQRNVLIRCNDLRELAPVEYATAANRKGNERVPNSYAWLSGLSDARQPFGFHAVMIFATAVTRNS